MEEEGVSLKRSGTVKFIGNETDCSVLWFSNDLVVRKTGQRQLFSFHTLQLCSFMRGHLSCMHRWLEWQRWKKKIHLHTTAICGLALTVVFLQNKTVTRDEFIFYLHVHIIWVISDKDPVLWKNSLLRLSGWQMPLRWTTHKCIAAN